MEHSAKDGPKLLKTCNLPLVPGIDPPEALTKPHRAFVVGLVASRSMAA